MTYVYTISNDEPSSVKVYYDNANNWTNVYCYVYTIDGRIINNVRSASELNKGVYIVNGKKIVVR